MTSRSNAASRLRLPRVVGIAAGAAVRVRRMHPDDKIHERLKTKCTKLGARSFSANPAWVERREPVLWGVLHRRRYTFACWQLAKPNKEMAKRSVFPLLATLGRDFQSTCCSGAAASTLSHVSEGRRYGARLHTTQRPRHEREVERLPRQADAIGAPGYCLPTEPSESWRTERR